MRVPLNISPGINLEHTSFDLKDAAWLNGDGVRFVEGRPEALGKFAAMPIGGATLNGTCRSVFGWTAGDAGGAAFAAGTNTKLYAGLSVGGNVSPLYDITPALFTTGPVNGSGGGGGPFNDPGINTSPLIIYSPLSWSFGAWGRILIACPFGPIYECDGGNIPAGSTVVTNSPAISRAVLVAPITRQVVAIGCTTAAGVYNGRCIRFSDVEDRTSWTPSTTNLAYEYILPSVGRIIGARFVGAYLFVWTESSLYIGSFVGDPSQVWRFDLAGENCGLAGPLAVTNDQQSAFWINRVGKMMTASVGSAPVTVDSPVLRDAWSHVATDQAEKIVCSTLGRFGEIWTFYPDSRDGTENSRAVLVNAQGQWSKQTISRTAFMDVGALTYPVGVASTAPFWHDYISGTTPTASIETGAQYLDNAGRRVMVKQFWPDIKDQAADVTVTIYGRDEPEAAETTLYTGTATTSTQRLDFIINTRLVRVKFSSAGYFRLGKPTFDAQPSSKW